MTTILQSKYKASRRLGTALWGGKDAITRRNYRPGQQGQVSIGKKSTFKKQLEAKQKLRFHYGRISERQFRNIFREAARLRRDTGEALVGLLESRLDIVLYRANIAPTVFAARQLVSHKHACVNGAPVNIPSYRLRPGDVVTLKEASRELAVVQDSLERMERHVPEYVSLDATAPSATLVRVPELSEVPYPFEVEMSLIVEYYS